MENLVEKKTTKSHVLLVLEGEYPTCPRTAASWTTQLFKVDIFCSLIFPLKLHSACLHQESVCSLTMSFEMVNQQWHGVLSWGENVYIDLYAESKYKYHVLTISVSWKSFLENRGPRPHVLLICPCVCYLISTPKNTFVSTSCRSQDHSIRHVLWRIGRTWICRLHDLIVELRVWLVCLVSISRLWHSSLYQYFRALSGCFKGTTADYNVLCWGGKFSVIKFMRNKAGMLDSKSIRCSLMCAFCSFAGKSLSTSTQIPSVSCLSSRTYTLP